MSDYSGLFRLDGRRALVVGAGSGIGAAAAAGLASFGAEVVCADIQLEAAHATAAAHPGATALRLDIGDPASVAQLGLPRRAGHPGDHAVGERAQAHRRLHRRRAGPRRRPQPQGDLSTVPHRRRADGRGRPGQHDRHDVHPVPDHRAGPGRLRRHQGGDGDAVQDAGGGVGPAGRASQHDRPGCRRDPAHAAHQGPWRVVRRLRRQGHPPTMGAAVGDGRRHRVPRLRRVVVRDGYDALRGRRMDRRRRPVRARRPEMHTDGSLR